MYNVSLIMMSSVYVIESIHFTDVWSQTKEVIPVVFPIQSI